MYIGPRTDEPPMPSPPMKRNNKTALQFQANAQPAADTTYKIAIQRKLARRPRRSPGMPASMEPITVPIRAAATVNPFQNGVRW